MELLVEDVAELLKVPKSTVARWVADGQIPAYQIRDEVRFDPKEVEAWVLKQQTEPGDAAPLITIPRSMQEKSPVTTGSIQYSLYRAIHRGFVYKDVPGKDKAEVIRETMHRLATSLNLDADVLTEMLLDRERLMPTALNKGVAVPHTRDFLLSTHYDVVTIVYPKTPIEYDALDGQPVHSMFFLFACEDKRHLNLLAKLAHFASDDANLEYLQTKPAKTKLLQYIKTWEGDL